MHPRADQGRRAEGTLRHRLSQITGVPFFNLSKFTIAKPAEKSGLNGLLDDPNQLAPNLNSYINGFSPDVRAIIERFKFPEQIAYMAEKDLLYLVIQKFAAIDLSPDRVDNVQMGYVFEELIRIGAEQSNEEAGEHFTPREVIKLMVNLLLSPEKDLARSHVVKTIYDPACGTGGMLSVAEKYIRDLNADAQPKLFGQDWNDEAWAVCKSDMLIKGEDADAIILGDTFTKDGFDRTANIAAKPGHILDHADVFEPARARRGEYMVNFGIRRCPASLDPGSARRVQRVLASLDAAGGYSCHRVAVTVRIHEAARR